MAEIGVRNRNSRKSDNKLVKFVIRLSLVSITLFLSYQSLQTIVTSRQKSKIVESVRQEVDDLRLKNLKIYIEESEVTSDDHFETESRDRLNYTRDGEVVFVIDEQLLADPSLDIYIEEVSSGRDKAKVFEKEVYIQWIDFFKGFKPV